VASSKAFIQDGLYVAGMLGKWDAGKIQAAAELRREQKAGAARKIDKYRAENPDDFRTWETKHGCVIQFWGMRVYYGRCRDCSDLVTTTRDVSQYKEGPTMIGRWPALCEECRQRKRDEDAAAARRRMAELRRKRYRFRDEQFRKAGLPATRQGVPSYEARMARTEREEDDYLNGGYVGDPEWDL